MTVEMTTKQRTQRRAQANKQEISFAPLRIELTNEEILADLHYPAPLRRRRRV